MYTGLRFLEKKGAMVESDVLICMKCNLPLEIGKAKFSYLSHEMVSEVPLCPICGQVYLTEELVNGRIRAIEGSLEDK